mmetsp:Transcript_7070/g.12084  ORF Transcript_7070/g.12084 Transcript_7070/m.12084 type:complete len:83 (-) Transcript_7070:126-374(-)
MPRMSGVDATRAILKECAAQTLSPPRIVALTANVDSGVESQCRDAGMCACIAKPFRKDDILAVITRLSDPSPRPLHPKHMQP